jgi:hypothetical protein
MTRKGAGPEAWLTATGRPCRVPLGRIGSPARSRLLVFALSASLLRKKPYRDWFFLRHSSNLLPLEDGVRAWCSIGDAGRDVVRPVEGGIRESDGLIESIGSVLSFTESV